MKDDIRRWHGVDMDVDVLFLGAWSSYFKSGDPKKKKKANGNDPSDLAPL